MRPLLLSVKEFCKLHSSFTEGSIRYLIYYAESNGFKPCFKRIGSRVFIDEMAFFACVDRVNMPDFKRFIPKRHKKEGR
jgi:hypothetical protein